MSKRLKIKKGTMQNASFIEPDKGEYRKPMKDSTAEPVIQSDNSHHSSRHGFGMVLKQINLTQNMIMAHTVTDDTIIYLVLTCVY